MKIKSVDIALCTWNRSRLLTRTLDGFTCLDVPRDIQLTIIVVDNNSTDDTPAAINSFTETEFATQHRLVHVQENRQGHTFARNRAIAESTGDLMIWTDDDVLVRPDWLAQYRAAADNQPDTDFWGGRIDPLFESGRPKWIGENWPILAGCFATRDLGDTPRALTAGRLPYGANFGVRGHIQRANGFNEQLGRRGEEVLGEDELDMMTRLVTLGHQGNWLPDAPVQHLIPADRSTTGYVFDYFCGQGKKLALKGQAWHSDVAAMKKEAKSEYRRYWAKRFFAPSNVWCSHLVRSGLATGQWQALKDKKP